MSQIPATNCEEQAVDICIHSGNKKTEKELNRCIEIETKKCKKPIRNRAGFAFFTLAAIIAFLWFVDDTNKAVGLK